ncbi:uncharacterized protein PG998_006316 [Apiospora kogelbergensis]|uniref:uncharacterized protein n=1 Tax=Apiospora kogelbergensis TaxID=1337665 RepID=UPI003130976E
MSQTLSATVETTTLADHFQPDELEAEAHSHAMKVANGFRARDDGKALLAILANYAVIGTCVAVSERAWAVTSLETPALGWAAYTAACVLIASRMRGFECLVHEASHYNLFETPATHYALQWLYSFPIFRVLEDYRQSHLTHHQRLGDATRDPDLIRIVALGLDHAPDAPIYYLLFLPLSGYIHWEYLTTTFADYWAIRAGYPNKAIFWLVVLAAAVVHAPTARLLSLYYAVPFFIILPVLRYWAEAAEHIGLDLTRKFGHSRSNLGFVHKWLMNPHNDGYHAVHHLHAQVPFHQLPSAHTALLNQNEAFAKRSAQSDGFFESMLQMARNRTIMKRGAEKQ